MSAPAVILALCGARVHVFVRDGRLVTQGRVPEALRPVVKTNRDAILRLLEDPAALRREAYLAWEKALSQVANNWDVHAAEARQRGKEPAWINDEDLSATVREAILEADLPAALMAIEAWREEWLKALGPF